MGAYHDGVGHVMGVMGLGGKTCHGGNYAANFMDNTWLSITNHVTKSSKL